MSKPSPFTDFLALKERYYHISLLRVGVLGLGLAAMALGLWSLGRVITQNNANYVPLIVVGCGVGLVLWLGVAAHLRARTDKLWTKGQAVIFKHIARENNWAFRPAEPFYSWCDEDDPFSFAVPKTEFMAEGAKIKGQIKGRSFEFGDLVFADFSGRSDPDTPHQRVHYKVRQRLCVLRIPLSRDFGVRVCHSAQSDILQRFDESRVRGGYAPNAGDGDPVTALGILRIQGQAPGVSKHLQSPRTQEVLAALISGLKGREFRLVVCPEVDAGEGDQRACVLTVLIRSDQALGADLKSAPSGLDALEADLTRHVKTLKACVHALAI